MNTHPKLIKNYKDLIVWQKSMTLCNFTYELVNHFPKEELFGLTSQIKRCAVSIPSNIAEGFGRGSNKNFINFLKIAYGSLVELETQLLIAHQRKFTKLQLKKYNICMELIQELTKMLGTLIGKLKHTSR